MRLSSTAIKTTKNNLKKYPKIKFAYLYGSYAQDKATKKSDIDIALYGNVTPKEKVNIRRKLSNSLQKDVDLVIINKKTNPFFAHQIFNKGILLFEKNKPERILHETNMELKYFDNLHFQDKINKIAQNRLGVI